MVSDIQIALRTLQQRHPTITKYQRYYDGDHDLAFATEKFDSIFGHLFEEFAYNMCANVVDAVSDRLRLLSFGTSPAALKAWDVWQANQMNEQAGQLYQAALTAGVAYMIVWPGGDGTPQLSANPADLVMVRYDPDNPRVVAWAAKAWRTDRKTVRLTLYYPDRIEKYETGVRNDTTSLPSDAAFQPYKVNNEAWPLPNPLGRVPVVPFVNNAKLGNHPQSELKNVIPLQDALNKAIDDMLVGMEFAALPQRWATGLEIRYDKNNKPIKPFEPGVERVWFAPEGAAFGQFDAANLEQFLAVIEAFELKIARVSRTSLHFLQLFSGQPPSGEALKTSETPFLNKVGDRMEAWGNAWVQVMELALLILKQSGDGTTYTPGDLDPDWRDPAPKSSTEAANTAKTKGDIGVPFPWLARDLDYTEQEIADMETYRAGETAQAEQQAAARLALAQQAVNSGQSAQVVLAASDTTGQAVGQ